MIENLFFFFSNFTKFSHSLTQFLSAPTHYRPPLTQKPLQLASPSIKPQRPPSSIHTAFFFQDPRHEKLSVFFQPFFTNFFPADRKTLGRKRGKKKRQVPRTRNRSFSLCLFYSVSLSLLLCLRLSRKKLVKKKFYQVLTR
jgi:hypothetical protein